jgi:heptosyltransferase-3
VDRVNSIDARALAGFFARNGQLAQDLSDYFSEFDLIVSYLYDPDEIFKTNVGRCSPAQFIAGPHRPDERAQIHAAKVFLKPLERLAIFDADHVPRLDVGDDVNRPLSEIGQEVPSGTTSLTVKTPLRLALHPGSGSDRKNWPEDRWAGLLQALINLTPFNLLMVGGEAEGERLQRLAAALPLARTRVAQSLPLAELARRLARCQGFIGHDSGISHLAAALGLPVLLLWGTTAEAVWRPPGQKVTVIRHAAGLELLSVEEVFGQLRCLWKAE